MRKTKQFFISLAVLACMASPALAQPAPNFQPGPGPMGGMPPMAYHHQHHWQHEAYGPPPGGWRPGYRFYGPPPIIIHDYSYYNLAPPPPGYYWVESGNQFLMIAIASGIIASILTAPLH